GQMPRLRRRGRVDRVRALPAGGAERGWQRERQPTEAAVRPGQVGEEAPQAQAPRNEAQPAHERDGRRPDAARGRRDPPQHRRVARGVVARARGDDGRVPAERLEVADELQGPLDARAPQRGEQVGEYEHAPSSHAANLANGGYGPVRRSTTPILAYADGVAGRTVLVVSQRPLEAGGGGSARWRYLRRALEARGW